MTIKEWNEKYPIGTPVRYFPILHLDDFIDAKTRTEAWPLGHGAAVVSIEGRSGGMGLDHLQPLVDGVPGAFFNVEDAVSV